MICLGATAAQSLLGTSFRITKQRGELLDLDGEELGLEHPPKLLATTHPSAVLRARDEDRKRTYAELLADLKVAAKVT